MNTKIAIKCAILAFTPIFLIYWLGGGNFERDIFLAATFLVAFITWLSLMGRALTLKEKREAKREHWIKNSPKGGWWAALK